MSSVADEPEQPELDPEVPEERTARGRRPRNPHRLLGEHGPELLNIPPGARTIRALRDRKKIIE